MPRFDQANVEREESEMAERKQDAQAERATALDNAMHEGGHAQNLAVEYSGMATAMQDQGKEHEYEQAMRQRADADHRTREAELRRIRKLTGEEQPKLLHVVSNRVDDRVALFEWDDRHPGGHAFVGGSAPDHVFATPAVLRLLNEGVLVEVPEPKEGPKKPLELSATTAAMSVATQPGQPVRLGRALDPDLFDEGAREQVQRVQASKPAEQPVPYGVTVPPPIGPERETIRR